MKTTRCLALLLSLCLALPAHAALCGQCRDRSYTKDIGECSACKGMTTSGEFRLCLSCSAKLGECAHCRAALPKKASAGAQPAVVDTTRNGTHSADGWVYQIAITNEGSRSQGVVGTLSFNGQVVAVPPHVNDYHVTPWGNLYWVGDPAVAWGAHGWMPKALAREPAGSPLPKP